MQNCLRNRRIATVYLNNTRLKDYIALEDTLIKSNLSLNDSSNDIIVPLIEARTFPVSSIFKSVATSRT